VSRDLETIRADDAAPSREPDPNGRARQQRRNEPSLQPYQSTTAGNAPTPGARLRWRKFVRGLRSQANRRGA